MTGDKTAAPPATCHLSPVTSPGRAWSLLRNRLCALTSPSGGFGFTCGVEWLATEKIRVHGNTGLNWESADNIVPELAQLNRLISDHPCFFDGAKLTRLSAPDSPVYALLRESAEGKDAVLILANTGVEKENSVELDVSALRLPLSAFKFDLLGQSAAENFRRQGQNFLWTSARRGLLPRAGRKTRRLERRKLPPRPRAGRLRLRVVEQNHPAETIDGLDWRWLAEHIERSPKNFLAAVQERGRLARASGNLPHAGGPPALLSQAGFSALAAAAARGEIFPRVVTWTLLDTRRVTPVPAGHWLLIEDSMPFRATLETGSAAGGARQGTNAIHVQSIPAGNVHVAGFAPREAAEDAGLFLERHGATSQKVSAAIRFLAPEPQLPSTLNYQPSTLVLLTNGRGGMARLCVDLGRVNSKYDCALGANLHPAVPVDRHVFVKRLRVWVNADGFLSPLDFENLAAFKPGSPAIWNFVANAGDGRTVEIELRAEMIEGENTTVFQFSRPTEKLARGKQLPAEADVRLTVRVDIEDRNFHCETKRNGGAEHHFSSNCRKTQNASGFEFTPATDRQLRVSADAGEYHPQPEWCENIPHPVEQSRGQVGSGDAYSPGWFELPLAKGASVKLVLTAEVERRSPTRLVAEEIESQRAGSETGAPFAARLARAAKQFVVRRADGKTVIAGYPWFLDWGRDSLICARGLLAAGLTGEVKQILLAFAKFEQDGTLPNTINGNDVSNRDTSDAPLWFAVVCEDFSEIQNSEFKIQNFFDTPVDENRRTIRDVLGSIAENYVRGTPNGIRMDADSALIWSPSHFTWMDTNFPAGTPREGYPVEIQALWIRLLRLLGNISAQSEQKKWRDLAGRAAASFEKLFWLEDKGWFADVLLGGPRVIARDATISDALRSNCLFAVSLGLISGGRAKRCVEAARKFLAVPGGLRTLAPLPVATPLPVYRDGHLLNNPAEPYHPRYEGDEDTRRKPAYHNGTAWTWTFPAFCEALARAWDFSPAAVAAAKSYLGSAEQLLNEGCLGQLPEILDGDAPHAQRGCDAQAWGATETLRVWKMLNEV